MVALLIFIVPSFKGSGTPVFIAPSFKGSGTP